MNKKIVNSLLAGSLALGLIACSNDDNVNGDGFATFFHSVPDAGLLRFEGDTRNYGSVDYQRFGSGIPLEEKSWDLTIKDFNKDDISASRTILDTNFEVFDTRERNVYAVSGSAIDKTVKLHRLKTAIDRDSRTFDVNGDTEEDNIWINVAHIHPKYQDAALDVYLLEGAETVANSSPEFTLNYGSYSGGIRLETNKQRVVVVNTQDEAVLFDSGERNLLDQFTQMIMLVQHPSIPDAMQGVYYWVSGSEIWGTEGDGSVAARAKVRLLNAVRDTELNEAEATGKDDVSLLSGATVAYGAVSDAVEVTPGLYDIDLGFASASEKPGLSRLLQSGYVETVIVTGRAGDDEELNVTVMSDDGRSLQSKARVQFVNLAYQSDEDRYVPYNVHLLKENSLEDLRSRVPELAGSEHLGVGSLEKIVASTSTDGERYEIRVMKQDNIERVATIQLTLKEGDNKQVALIQRDSGSGFKLIDISAVPAP
ncbi:Uncharacterised protein [BD1-7 clade bacterium]|uniref:DUF4397 domain-containing protein n=1 Tax=BD1-7 clade bacterium TaxID=2029982 RepID=A0A5S9QW37_9GAMM|nr:Uncharacterised protein [BD1-7 clade bacterium]